MQCYFILLLHGDSENEFQEYERPKVKPVEREAGVKSGEEAVLYHAIGMAVHCDRWSRPESHHSIALYDQGKRRRWPWDYNKPYLTATSICFQSSTSLHNSRKSTNRIQLYSGDDSPLLQWIGDGETATEGSIHPAGQMCPQRQEPFSAQLLKVSSALADI